MQTDFRILMKLASELAKAKKTGNELLIQKAKMQHDNYVKLCLESDQMIIGCTQSFLDKG